MRRIRTKSGFTLIEVIATLVIVAVLGTVAYVYFGKGFLESVSPVTRLKHTAALHRVMENIRADYNVYPKWRSGTSYAAGASVIPSNPNRSYYTCTTAGTSSALEPDWWSGGPTYTESTGVMWKGSGSLKALLPLQTLKNRIGGEGSSQSTNDYGKNSDGTYTTYTVVVNRFVRFDTNDKEQDDPSGNILKVTLQNENGETLTSLFLSD
jgi:prepilin-type N-terminal cleavage/methylation domain-containing protein